MAKNASNYIPNPELGFKIAEKPVKLLIHSYLKMFAKDKILATTKKIGLGVAYFRIPPEYISREEVLRNFCNLPKEFAKRNSLYFIPDEVSCGEFKKIPRVRKKTEKQEKEEYEEWEIFLEAIDTTQPDPEWKKNQVSLDHFGNSKGELTQIIGGTYNAARGVFYSIKASHMEELETVDLEINDKDFYVELKDSRFPKYVHTTKIYFRLNKIFFEDPEKK